MKTIQSKGSKLIGGVVVVPRSCCDGGYLPVVINNDNGTAYLHHVSDEDRTKGSLSSLPADCVDCYGAYIDGFQYEVCHLNDNPRGECAPAEEASPEVHALMEEIIKAMNTSRLYHF